MNRMIACGVFVFAIIASAIFFNHMVVCKTFFQCLCYSFLGVTSLAAGICLLVFRNRSKDFKDSVSSDGHVTAKIIALNEIPVTPEVPTIPTIPEVKV